MRAGYFEVRIGPEFVWPQGAQVIFASVRMDPRKDITLGQETDWDAVCTDAWVEISTECGYLCGRVSRVFDAWRGVDFRLIGYWSGIPFQEEGTLPLEGLGRIFFAEQLKWSTVDRELAACMRRLGQEEVAERE